MCAWAFYYKGINHKLHDWFLPDHMLKDEWTSTPNNKERKTLADHSLTTEAAQYGASTQTEIMISPHADFIHTQHITSNYYVWLNSPASKDRCSSKHWVAFNPML